MKVIERNTKKSMIQHFSYQKLHDDDDEYTYDMMMMNTMKSIKYKTRMIAMKSLRSTTATPRPHTVRENWLTIISLQWYLYLII